MRIVVRTQNPFSYLRHHFNASDLINLTASVYSKTRKFEPKCPDSQLLSSIDNSSILCTTDADGKYVAMCLNDVVRLVRNYSPPLVLTSFDSIITLADEVMLSGRAVYVTDGIEEAINWLKTKEI